MSDAGDVATGLAGGALVTAAMQAAGQPVSSGLFVGGAMGLFLALIPRSRTGGVALLLASVAGAVVVAQRPKRRAA